MQEKDLHELKKLSQDQLIDMILQQSKQLSEQSKQISDLQNQVDVLLEMQRLARVEKYKPKCEQVETLFDELEVIDTFSDKENPATVVKEHTRKKAVRQCAQAAADTPVYVNDHTSNAPEFLVRGEIRYSRIENKVIDKIAYVPASVSVERNIYSLRVRTESPFLKPFVLAMIFST